MTMRVLIIVDLNDEDLTTAYKLDRQPPSANAWGWEWDDLERSIDARLSEAGYMGNDNTPVRGKLVASSPVDHAMSHLLNCAEVGAEGSDHEDTDLVTGIIAQLRMYDGLIFDEDAVTRGNL